MSGVRVTGFFAEHSGFGEACRLHLRVLADAGVPLTGRAVRMAEEGSHDVAMPARRYPRTAALCGRAIPYEQTILHVIPEGFPLFRESGRRNIGMTVWETEVLPPQWIAPLAAVDELWVPSQHAQRAFAAAARCPVRLVPHPVRPPPPLRTDAPRTIPGIPDDLFLFLCIQEWSDRKNPLQLLRAFCDAFDRRRDVALLIKIGLNYIRNPELALRAVAEVLRGYRHPPPVYTICETLSAVGRRRLYQRADAYVSLHRCEGFGLCMAEAMAHGVPVVATAHSGNMDYMDDDSAFLVDYRLVPVKTVIGPHELWHPSMSWAEPSQEAAVAALRTCAADASRRQQRAEAGRRRVSQHLAPARVGQLMREYLGF